MILLYYICGYRLSTYRFVYVDYVVNRYDNNGLQCLHFKVEKIIFLLSSK